MPQIPIFQHTPKSLDSSNVRANPKLFDDQFRAAARLGESVSGLGQQIADFAGRVQRADDFAKLTDAELELRATYDGFQSGINQSSNPDELLSEWNHRIDGVIANQLSKAPASIRRQIDDQAKRFRGRTVAEVGVTARTLSVDRAKKRGLVRLDQAWDDGDAESAEVVMAQMSSMGLIAPEDIPTLREKGVRQMDVAAAYREINLGPAAALEMLEARTEGGRPKFFTNLDESQRYGIAQAARGALNSLRAETQNDFAERRFAGEVIPENELQGAVSRGIVSPKWAESFRKQQLKDLGGNAGSPVAFAQLLTNITAYDPTQDAGSVRYGELFASAMLLPEKMAADAIQRLKQRADPQSPLNSAVAKDIFQAIDKRFQLGFYGKYQSKKLITSGPEAGQWTTETDRKGFESALLLKTQVEDAARAFILSKPNATAEEVNRHVNEFQSAQASKVGRSTIVESLGLTNLSASENEDAESKRVKLDAILSKGARQ